MRERPALVVAHGMYGGRLLVPHLYFRGVEARLRQSGYDVLLPHVPAADTVEVRARSLIEQVARWPERQGRRVAVLAHSMGGLDMRYAISKLNGDELVSSLLTIGTPHRGSPVASLLLRAAQAIHLDRALESVPLALLRGTPRCAACLTLEACDAFNDDVRDSDDVAYLSVGGDRGVARTSPELMATYAFVSSKEGPNDGLVSVRSASWGYYAGTLDLDHFHQVNLPSPIRLAFGPSSMHVLDTYCELAASVTGASRPQFITQEADDA